MSRRTKHGTEGRLLKMKLKQELSTAKRVIKQEEMNLTDAIKYLKEIKQINIVNAGKLGVELTPKNFKDTGWDAEIKRLTNEYREQIRANIEAAQKQGIENQEEKDDRDDDIEQPPGGWDTDGQLTEEQKEVSSKWGGKRKTRRKRKTKKRRKKKTKKRRRKKKKKTKRRR